MQERTVNIENLTGRERSFHEAKQKQDGFYSVNQKI